MYEMYFRFIGELFKLRMLTEHIMHDCLKKLLNSNDDEDNIECLCHLLMTVGQDLDQKQAKVFLFLAHYITLM